MQGAEAISKAREMLGRTVYELYAAGQLVLGAGND